MKITFRYVPHPFEPRQVTQGRRWGRDRGAAVPGPWGTGGSAPVAWFLLLFFGQIS